MESIAPTNTPLADFFRLGVASPPPPQERTLTPTADRARSRGAAAAADERHRLGNKGEKHQLCSAGVKCCVSTPVHACFAARNDPGTR